MNRSEFNLLVKERFKKCAKLLDVKGDEYASDLNESRFIAFHAAARMDNETAAQALWGMWKKHIVSIQDIIKNDKYITRDMLDEKINDMINYPVLLEGVLTERGRVIE